MTVATPPSVNRPPSVDTDGAETQRRHDPSLAQPGKQPGHQGHRHAKRRHAHPRQDGDAAAKAHHAAHRKIKLADDHREAKAQRHRADGGELLQHAERCGQAQDPPTAAVEAGDHDGNDRQHEERALRPAAGHCAHSLSHRAR